LALVPFPDFGPVHSRRRQLHHRRHLPADRRPARHRLHPPGEIPAALV